MGRMIHAMSAGDFYCRVLWGGETYLDHSGYGRPYMHSTFMNQHAIRLHFVYERLDDDCKKLSKHVANIIIKRTVHL